MGIVEAGDHGPAADIDDLGSRALMRHHLGVGSHREEATIFDRHG
jgi:hypothetical protein